MGSKRRIGLGVISVAFLCGLTGLLAPNVLATDDGNVVIHRYQAGGSGAGAAKQEYIELYNNSGHDIDVTGWCVVYKGISSPTAQTVGCINGERTNSKVYLQSKKSVLFISAELETFVKTIDPAFKADILFAITSNLAASNGSIEIVNKNIETIDSLGWGLLTGEGLSAAGNTPGGKILQRISLDETLLKDSAENSLDFELVNAPGKYNGNGLYETIEQDVDPGPDAEPDTGERPDNNAEGPGCQAAAVFINEILANPAGADSDGGEFVELYNDSVEPVSLKSCLLTTDKEANMPLPEVTLDPGEFYAFQLADKLLNAGGTVTFITRATEDTVIYPALKDDEAWGFYESAWQFVRPTPGATNVLAASSHETCGASGVILTEILANPEGADTAGGEFVEFYNSGNQTADLTGCKIATDKDDSIELPGFLLQPGEYYALMLADKLLNGGGTVVFSGSDAVQSISYVSLGDNESWALINNRWEVTNIPTPGAPNQPSATEPRVLGANTVLESCPPGKFRNPETNRCKNIASQASSLIPCDPGQERNPKTNRCRKIATAGSSLSPCQSGYERNPETNRCRKVTSLSTGSSNTGPTTTSGATPLHPAILVSLSTLLLGYGLYEYRGDIFQALGKLKSKLLSKNA